jgi:hypothetical protein
MKHLFKLVAVVFAVLLAVAPALGEGLCSTLETSKASMECCKVDRVGTAIASSAVNQDCSEGCCSVAPQNPPSPGLPDKFKADSVAPDSIFAVLILKLHTSQNLTSAVLVAIRPTEDLPVLHRTFRI